MAFAILLLSLGRASSRDNWRPGSLPPPGEGGDTRFLFSLTGRIDNRLDSPLTVAVDRRGRVYVADGGFRTVQVFTADGVWQRSIGRPVQSDPQPGDLVYPLGVAVDDADNVYVSDNVTRHISVFDGEGNFLRYVTESVTDARSFSIPAGLFYRNGLLYVNDIGDNRVVGLHPDGAIVRVLGTGQGSDAYRMLYPNYSWVDLEDRVYVADSNNSRVQVFGPDGQTERILVRGHSSSPSSVLRGIALDSRGQLHVASTMEHRVLVFDRSGEFVSSYGSEGSGAGQLGFPNGLTIADERVYVADRANQRVQVWGFGTKSTGGR